MKKPLATLSAALLTAIAVSLLSGCVIHILPAEAPATAAESPAPAKAIVAP